LLPNTLEEAYRNKQIEAIAPEELLLHSTKVGIGCIVYIGTGKLTSTRFYYGVEWKLIFKHVCISAEETDKIMLDADSEHLTYYRNVLSGKVTYSMDFMFHKNFESSFCVRIGYFPINRALVYLKVGAAFNVNTYDKLHIKTNTTLQAQRLNDDNVANWGYNYMRMDIPNAQFTIPAGHRCYTTLNLGIGADYFLTKKVFIRPEYEYKIALSNRLRLSSNANLSESIYNSYSIRYQDKENCISFGIGMYL
jgi:opacity protein-like surface antigen